MAYCGGAGAFGDLRGQGREVWRGWERKLGVAKLPVDDAEKFCAWCLSDFRYCDEKTASLTPSGSVPEVKAETIMMAPAAGFYTTPGAGKDQVQLAYVLCKEDLQRALMILEKAIEEYRKVEEVS